MSDRATLLVGCGRLGAAMVRGWLGAGTPSAETLMLRNRSRRPIMDEAAAAGAVINPDLPMLASADKVVLAVKPAMWRAAAAEIAPHLAPDAVIVSVMAGVGADDIAAAFDGRTVVRVMPTTGVAAGRGAAAIWSEDGPAQDEVRALFEPIATVVPLEREAQMNASTAISGSGQAYFFALVQALAQAGQAQGLSVDAAAALARATLSSAAAGAQATDADIDTLIGEVASPGGTTRAALDVFAEGEALDRLVAAAVEAAANRARELASA